MEKDKQMQSNEQPTQQWESDAQKEIDRQMQSEQLKDMHLESGEKVNDYEV